MRPQDPRTPVEVRYEMRQARPARANWRRRAATLVKLNIGNPGAGFRAPDNLQHAIADRIARAPIRTRTSKACRKRAKPSPRSTSAAAPARRPERVFVGNGVVRT